MIALSAKEKRISDAAYWCKYARWYLIYVYYIRYRNRILYVGATINPYLREVNHSLSLYKRGIKSYQIDFIGPFELSVGLQIEETEIVRNKTKYLLNKNINHEYQKAFCIENFQRKTISFVRKRGKRKALVS